MNPMVQAIVQAHAPRLTGFPAQPTPSSHEADPVFQAALAACSALGFIATDALCLAHAWQAQTARHGVFDASHWPDAAEDFGLQGRAVGASFPPCPQRLGLYAVLPDANWIRRMAQAEVPTLQLRFKSSDPAAIQREVEAAVRAVEGTSARLFINDHWRQAMDAGAYGVHLGQDDLTALSDASIATLRASGLRLGISTHGYAEMLLADRLAPSYVAIGAIFPTTLKAMPTAPQGMARLRDYARLMKSSYPLVAIGGISEAQLPEIMATGVGSAAVVRAILQAPEPEVAAARLMRAISTQQQGAAQAAQTRP